MSKNDRKSKRPMHAGRAVLAPSVEMGLVAEHPPDRRPDHLARVGSRAERSSFLMAKGDAAQKYGPMTKWRPTAVGEAGR